MPITKHFNTHTILLGKDVGSILWYKNTKYTIISYGGITKSNLLKYGSTYQKVILSKVKT